MIKAAVYCRISRDAEKQGLGVARQEADCRTLVERRGWTLAEVMVDNDISATRKNGRVAERPSYRRLVAEIESGAIGAVVVWDQDRLVRDPMELERFLLACERAGMHHLATIGDEVNIDSGEGIMIARIKAAVAAEEVRKIRKRVRRKHLELAEEGKLSGGGRRPFGYEADRVTIRQDEAKLIRDAAQRVIAGESLRSIVLGWNRQGVCTVTGVPWSPTTVKRLLMSGRISGQREHHGEIVAEAEWPAIIRPEQTTRLRTILSDGRRFVGGGVVARSYLLSGIVVCGNCGARMTARPVVRKGHHYRRYVCAVDRGGCNKVGIGAQPLEDLVAEMVLVALDSPEFGIAMRQREQSSEEDDLHELVAADRAALASLTHDHYVDRIIGRAEFLAARRDIEARLEANEHRLASRTMDTTAQDLTGRGDALRLGWAEATLDRRRAVVSSVIDRIEIAPTSKANNKFDPSRVTPVWRF